MLFRGLPTVADPRGRPPPWQTPETNSSALRSLRQDVRLDLIGVREFVHAVEQAYNCQNFAEARVVQPELLDRGRVRVDAVDAPVRGRDRQGDDLLGERIDLAGPHDGLQPRPAQF